VYFHKFVRLAFESTGSAAFYSLSSCIKDVKFSNAVISASFTNQVSGTGSVKFSAVSGSDTMMKNGLQQSISTKHQCITAMKEYESKSFEELRTDDYIANRKGPSKGR